MNGKKIIEKYGIIDGHYDLGITLFNYKMMGEKNPLKDKVLGNWKRNNIKLIIAAIFIDDEFLPEQALVNALDQINIIYDEVKKNSELVMIIKSKEDMNYAIDNSKIGIIMSLEGLEPIQTDINLLNIFNRLGVKAAGLVWSRQNLVADGSRFLGKSVNNGLSIWGFEVLKEMEKLNMIVDISHLNDAGNDDVFNEYKGNIIASHSNCREINNITRNLTDEQILNIKDKNGIIGINGCMPIVTKDFNYIDKENMIKILCDHINHIKELIGIDYIGIGLDRCNDIELSSLRYGNRENELVDLIDDYSEVELIIEELIKRDYSEEDIGKILSGNFLRILQKSIK
jgi:membrane dipeptidase